MSVSAPTASLTTDVLVVGGGPAGTWAAIKAAQAGADVVLVDKGHCGSSGATASAGTGIWYVDEDPELREAAMASREGLGGFLADRRWMARVLDETHDRVDELATVQRYPFPRDAQGREVRSGVQGPEYMRRQRRRVQRLGVRILDHTPALELLTDREGTVSGAHVLDLASGETVRIDAGAVVLATGGCAFRSGTLGCDVDTGDGALMAAEVGADLSGMEFSNAYAIAPVGTSITKTAYYSFARFYRADGSLIEGAGSTKGRSVIARTLLEEPVFARIDLANADERRAMRLGQPNFFLPFDRQGIDPFTDLFEVTLLLEGTVRGTGGVRVHDDSCASAVPGLWVAGDTATRELICGGFTGGGSHNAAWAMSSGSWAGSAAAGFATGRRRPGAELVRAAGRAGLRAEAGGTVHHRDVESAVRGAVLPYENNYLRTGAVMERVLSDLHATWADAAALDATGGLDLLRSREAAAMTAHARWMFHAALTRTETRGMHKRLDHPEQDPAQHHRLTIGGLDEVWSVAQPLEALVPA